MLAPRAAGRGEGACACCYCGRVIIPVQTKYMQKSTVTASMTTMMDLPTVDHQDGLRQNFLRRRMRRWCLW
jgi:hypothetical protein